ncbi:MAG TPA: MEDS domain-containing protein [Candidatus Saccharimonadales bacterium]|nr:MEDS domain-containing protein [Candidatus Saccharimonadales bacterium]
MGLGHAIKEQAPHSHFCAFYDTQTQRLRLLAEYYKVGLARNERCIFVTDQDPAELTMLLKRYGLDIKAALSGGEFQIFSATDTYLPGGVFNAQKMLDNLKDFVKKALELQFAGVRGGGDMDWLAKDVPGRQDISDYEAEINRFIGQNNFTGLCLFPADMSDVTLTKAIIKTHQEILRNDTLYPNLYYSPPEEFFRPASNIPEEIQRWLDYMDKVEARLPKRSRSRVLKQADAVVAELLTARF